MTFQQSRSLTFIIEYLKFKFHTDDEDKIRKYIDYYIMPIYNLKKRLAENSFPNIKLIDIPENLKYWDTGVKIIKKID